MNRHQQVRVTYDDEPGPEEFSRVSRDLAKGGASGRKSFLWLRRQAQQQPATRSSDEVEGTAAEAAAVAVAPAAEVTAGDAKRAVDSSDRRSASASDNNRASQPLPISEVVIGFGSTDPNVEEAAQAAEKDRGGADGGATATGDKREILPWERLDRSLNPAAVGELGDGQGREAAVFLWYRRGSEDESLSWSSHSLGVREDIRILDWRGLGSPVPGTYFSGNLYCWARPMVLVAVPMSEPGVYVYMKETRLFFNFKRRRFLCHDIEV